MSGGDEGVSAVLCEIVNEMLTKLTEVWAKFDESLGGTGPKMY